ncbi:MAG: Unknown protein [uncultured Sulfurovum sp.]|uniref:Uncharacterized protein n=1 Tax=uncultured Sulfurovum sp. TaxID=269237 RepID=A0A6S6SZR8_9BACT|nr:MAG: Unknown protein [uncultured Sulfurovum sp.]
MYTEGHTMNTKLFDEEGNPLDTEDLMLILLKKMQNIETQVSNIKKTVNLNNSFITGRIPMAVSLDDITEKTILENITKKLDSLESSLKYSLSDMKEEFKDRQNNHFNHLNTQQKKQAKETKIAINESPKTFKTTHMHEAPLHYRDRGYRDPN